MKAVPDRIYRCPTGPDRLVVAVTATVVTFIEAAADGRFHLRGAASAATPEVFQVDTLGGGAAPVGPNRLTFEQ